MPFCVIGDRDSILGYQLAGAGGWPVQDESSARQAFRHVLAQESCRIVLLVHPAEVWLAKEIEAHRKTSRPPLVAAVAGLASGAPPMTLVQQVQMSVGLSPARTGS
jgi:vacuolar-type H+-ATPase subunit F/Vma7